MRIGGSLTDGESLKTSLEDLAVGNIGISRVDVSRVRPQPKALIVVARKAYHGIGS